MWYIFYTRIDNLQVKGPTILPHLTFYFDNEEDKMREMLKSIKVKEAWEVSREDYFKLYMATEIMGDTSEFEAEVKARSRRLK